MQVFVFRTVRRIWAELSAAFIATASLAGLREPVSTCCLNHENLKLRRIHNGSLMCSMTNAVSVHAHGHKVVHLTNRTHLHISCMPELNYLILSLSVICFQLVCVSLFVWIPWTRARYNGIFSFKLRLYTTSISLLFCPSILMIFQVFSPLSAFCIINFAADLCQNCKVISRASQEKNISTPAPFHSILYTVPIVPWCIFETNTNHIWILCTKRHSAA